MAIWFNRDNTLRGNTANDNGGDGFNISASPQWPSSTNELTDNTATGNGGVGFNLNSGTMANVLTLNTANTNGIAGFVVLDASSANELRENAAHGNVRFGFAVTADAVSNTLTQNVACENPEWDAIQFEPNLGNVWTDNAFCTSSGIPIQYTWDLVKDWRNAPDQLNPSPDAYGNPGAWSYMASGSLAHDPAAYRLLPNYWPDGEQSNDRATSICSWGTTARLRRRPDPLVRRESGRLRL